MSSNPLRMSTNSATPTPVLRAFNDAVCSDDGLMSKVLCDRGGQP